MDNMLCHLELRADGAILVRVPPANPNLVDSLPDAVFSFRKGDPQYSYWRARYDLKMGSHSAAVIETTALAR